MGDETELECHNFAGDNVGDDGYVSALRAAQNIMRL